MSTSPLDAILPSGSSIPLQPFPPSSRYAGVELASGTFDGIEVKYATRRFLPDPARFVSVHEHVVRAGERADHLAYLAYNDPERSWTLGDANNVMALRELEEIG